MKPIQEVPAAGEGSRRDGIEQVDPVGPSGETVFNSSVLTDRRVHLIGVGGVGMAALAVLLENRGWEVSGCDLRRSPRTDWLEAHGVTVAIGHDPAHLVSASAAVVTPAVPAAHPEYVAARARAAVSPGFLRRRGEVLAELVSAASDSVAVCGSHGKTTTATFIAKLLLALGEDVEWAIGGETGDFPVAGRRGNGSGRAPVLVVEADESDGTLALYRARTLVVTNCEYDHPDHFKTRADYVACYETAKRRAVDVIESEALDLPDLRRFACLKGLPAHNVRNARAAIEVALRRGHAPDRIAAALPSVVAALPDRRFQPVWPVGGRSAAASLVVTDYAHHPTEMRCAVAMARQVLATRGGGRLRVLFQPHRYSRTKALLAEFPAAFEGADEVVLCPTYAAFEQPVEGGDVADLYAACRGVCAAKLFLARTCDEAWEHARNSMTDADLTLLLGAGDIVNLVPRIQRDMSAGRPPSPSASVRRIWIGAGSNTWKSDLNLSVAYVKTEGPAGRPGASLGIPWMAGIPGTVGGWVKMNAGAFGHSISEVVRAVKVDGRWIPAADCGFAYRHSDLSGEIQDVEFGPLPSGDPQEFLARRRKFPAGTFGSFFKNPEGDFAGRLLEAAGCKELRVGGAYVWSEHANVIVRGADATPSDVLALARLMRNRVLFRFGVALEPEVRGVSLA